MRCDLHIHTTASDGALSPAEAVEQAASAGLQVVSLTDHDTVAAYEGLRTPPGLTVIKGVEVSCSVGSGAESEELHILAYFPRGFSASFRAFLERQQVARAQRVEAAIERLGQRGIALTLEDVQRERSGSMIGRPQLARALVSRGHVASIGEAFRYYLGPSHGVVPPLPLRPRQAIDVIRIGGGVSVWAHPTAEQLRRHLDGLCGMALNGLEVFHRRHAGPHLDALVEAARGRKLLVAGGSDHHGHHPDDRIGAYKVPASKLRQLLSLCGVSAGIKAGSRQPHTIR